tara:strand:+ start:817 stop:1086 length:270 start_codon:yes stop_codon:yes gene_type:complete
MLYGSFASVMAMASCLLLRASASIVRPFILFERREEEGDSGGFWIGSRFGSGGSRSSFGRSGTGSPLSTPQKWVSVPDVSRRGWHSMVL